MRYPRTDYVNPDPPLEVYEFTVYDAEGVWGAIRCVAATEDEAQTIAARYLEDWEVVPTGSLAPDFTLDYKRAYASDPYDNTSTPTISSVRGKP